MQAGLGVGDLLPQQFSRVGLRPVQYGSNGTQPQPQRLEGLNLPQPLGVGAGEARERVRMTAAHGTVLTVMVEVRACVETWGWQSRSRS